MGLYTIVLFFHVSGAIGYFVGISVLLILVTGFYLALTAWSLWTGWIAVALISLLLLVPSGAALIEPRRRAIARLAQEAPDGLLSQALEQRIHDPILGTALQTVTILLLGIVFLMTNKPSLIGSLIVMAVALVLGLASGALIPRATRTQEPRVATPVDRMREPVR